MIVPLVPPGRLVEFEKNGAVDFSAGIVDITGGGDFTNAMPFVSDISTIALKGRESSVR